MSKQKIGVVFSILLILSLLSACGPATPTAPPAPTQPAPTPTQPAPTPTQPAPTPTEAGPTPCAETATLTVFAGWTGEQAKTIEEINKKFEEENPCIKIDFQTPGSEHEHLLKIKMAANDMPDVWWTHGWGKLRYGSFLADLRDRSWVSQIEDFAKPYVTDESGKVYILPITWDKVGLAYNADILKEYGIEPPFETYDEWMAACETIKTKSAGEVSCVHFGAGDIWPIGVYYDWFATAVLVSPEENQQQALMDRTFSDWDKFTFLSEKLLELQEKGYLNKDVLTAKFADTTKAFAEGKTAFMMIPPFGIEEAKKINPDLNANVMPVPAMAAGDEPSLVGGENATWGVWKDSKNLDAALAFVDFCAKPENVKKMADVTKAPPALKGVTFDAGYLSEFYQEYANLRVFPWFDRVYLPNGMWDVFCKAAADVLSGTSTPEQATKYMTQEYQRLVEAEKAAE